MKNTLVVTHERAGTHLVINTINYENFGDFKPIGKLPKYEKHDLEHYIQYANLSMLYEPHQPNLIYKSHHQVFFFEENIEELFKKYNVIYVNRDLKDILVSYYKFLNGLGFDSDGNSLPIKGFPEFNDWIFMKPCDVGYKYFEKYPDPHIYIEPKDYIDRYQLHYEGWMKYKDRLLIIDYEEMLTDFVGIKKRLELFLNKKVADRIPYIYDKKLPNFAPNKGIAGSYKDVMDDSSIDKIQSRLNENYILPEIEYKNNNYKI